MKFQHWRDAYKSIYLSSADVDGSIELTIKHVRFEPDKTKRTKDSFNTAYFVEKEIRPGHALKPMILNVGNADIVRGFAGGSNNIHDWNNIKVQLYVQEGVTFGKEVMQGLRINPTQPRGQIILAIGGRGYNEAVDAFIRDGSLDTVREFCVVPPDVEATIKEDAAIRIADQQAEAQLQQAIDSDTPPVNDDNEIDEVNEQTMIVPDDAKV